MKIKKATFDALLELAEQHTGAMVMLGAKKGIIIDYALAPYNPNTGCIWTYYTSSEALLAAANTLHSRGLVVLGAAQLQSKGARREAHKYELKGCPRVNYGEQHIYIRNVPILLAYPNGEHKAFIINDDYRHNLLKLEFVD